MFLAMLLAAQVVSGPSATEFAARFTPETPEMTVQAPWFFQYGAQVDIASPQPDKPLDRYAVDRGVCVYGQSCRFRLSVILLLADFKSVLVPVGVRYLLDRPGEVRAEGFARAPAPGGAYTFYRVHNGQWTTLPAGTHEVNEEAFVQATAKFVAAQ